MRWVLLVILALVAVSARAGAEPRRGAVAGKVSVKAGDKPKDDRSGVIVYLEGVSGGGRQAPKRLEMRQQDKAFVPPVLVAQKGDTIEFPNGDRIFHNVFSLSKGQSFDLGLHKAGTRPATTLDRPGQIDVFCNIHPQMVATIKVLENGFHATTDRSGGFKITGVPPGTYPVVAWTSAGKEQRQTVTVEAGKTAQVELEVIETRRTRPHVRKDGTPYPRY